MSSELKFHTFEHCLKEIERECVLFWSPVFHMHDQNKFVTLALFFFILDTIYLMHMTEWMFCAHVGKQDLFLFPLNETHGIICQRKLFVIQAEELWVIPTWIQASNHGPFQMSN